MAKKITFEIDVDDSGAVKSINKLDDSIKDVGDSAKKAEKTTKGFGKTLGNLAKGAGIIGLISAAFEVLREALNNNQKVMDVLSNVTTSLGIIFNDLFNLIADNVTPAIEYMTNLFSDIPGLFDKIKTAIYENLEVRFNALIKTFGLLGDAITKVFSGDFSGAMESASEAAETYVDVLTGVEGTVDKVVDGVNDLVDATTDYVTETYNAADAITQQAKSTRLLELQQTRLREQYDRDAERQRQIRDDETKGIDERIAANEELARILDEQEKLEKQTVSGRIAALQAEQQQLGFTQERYEEIYALNSELSAIEAQQAGFRSEQLVNENALLKEKAELLGFQTQAELDGYTASIDAQVAKAEAEYLISEKKVQDELDLLAAKYEAEKELAELNGEDTAAITNKYEKQKLDIVKKSEDAKDKIKKEAVQTGLGLAQTLASGTLSMAKEGTEAAKAAGVASVGIDVATGIVGAWTGINSKTGPLGIAAAVAQSAAIVATGVSSVKSILAVKTPSKGVSASSAGVSAASAAPPAATITPPNFTTAADTGTSQLAADINQQNEPVQAYVVSEKVTAQQQLDRQVEINTEF